MSVLEPYLLQFRYSFTFLEDKTEIESEQTVHSSSYNLYAQKVTRMQNLAFWNALKSIELNKNRILQKNCCRIGK